MFSIKNPTLSDKILKRKMEDFAATGAEKILTSCPGCVLQLNEGTIKFGKNLEVQHIADFVASKLLTKDEIEKLDTLVEELKL
jgi:glycolate oxidase iron-sulfur subunit